MPAKQEVIAMIDRLPEQQLQKIVNYIVLLGNNDTQKKRTRLHPIMRLIRHSA